MKYLNQAIAIAIVTTAFLGTSAAFSPVQITTRTGAAKSHLRQEAKTNDEDADADDDTIDISNRDWRAFRAQLVMSDSPKDEPSQSQNDNGNGNTSSMSSSSSSIIYDNDLDGIGSLFTEEETPMNTENFTPLEPSQWAYDAGHVIEKGAVILGGVEQDYGFGLRQQYFHKAVILVLDHDINFTKGIILNRPTDLLLVHEHEDESNNKWRIWFGGDVQNLNHAVPEIVCMHTLKGIDSVDEVSTTVMKDIQWCSFENATMLVKEGKAKPLDFWCFAGYAGWGPGQLMGELDRKSWYMCATDSQTLLKELAKQSAYTDPRDAGLDTWELLMGMIGRGETADEYSGDFEDLMLKEWARENLLSVEAGGNAGIRLQPAQVASTNMDLVQGESVGVDETDTDTESATGDELMKQAAGVHRGVGVGSLLRASSSQRSPYLLNDQEFHKAIVLLIADDENMSVGLILNQPSSKGVEIKMVDRKSGTKRDVMMPVRFGGQFAIRGEGALLWFHYSAALREAKVGSPVGADDGIWKCSQDDAISAISAALAKPNDFIIVNGLSVWTKGERGAYQGMQGEVNSGKFEVMEPEKIGQVWNMLVKQDTLTKVNLIQNLNNGDRAWKAAGGGGGGGGGDNTSEDDAYPVTAGIGEGFDEEDDALVFKSDVRVAKLSDDALRTWVATFLLGAPSLGA